MFWQPALLAMVSSSFVLNQYSSHGLPASVLTPVACMGCSLESPSSSDSKHSSALPLASAQRTRNSLKRVLVFQGVLANFLVPANPSGIALVTSGFPKAI